MKTSSGRTLGNKHIRPPVCRQNSTDKIPTQMRPIFYEESTDILDDRRRLSAGEWIFVAAAFGTAAIMVALIGQA
jgi:hypothetical protein